MNDFTIVNEFTLPSQGLIYKRQINPQVKLRSMTTVEEMKRLNHSDRAYKLMAEVINDCIVEDCGIHVYDMCIPDYQFLLHKLRIVTYGPNYKSNSRCPYCGSDNEHNINLETDLKLVPFDKEMYNKYSEITLPQSKQTIKLRMQSPRILDDITIKAKEIRKNSPGFIGDPAFLITLQNLIEEVNGKHYEDFQLDPFVRKLPMMDTNYILKAAQKLNTSFGLSSDLNPICKTCGLDYTTSFRITPEFFGPSIDYHPELASKYYKELVKERYLITKHTNTSYKDTAHITPLERNYIFEFILEELQKEKEAYEKIKEQNQGRR